MLTLAMLDPRPATFLCVPQSPYLQNGADNSCPALNKMLVERKALQTFKLLLLSREGTLRSPETELPPAFHSSEVHF